MSFIRRPLLAALVGLVSLAAAARVDATLLYEPNNSAPTAAVLPSGTFSVSASLDPLQIDTIVGEFDPTYTTLLQTAPHGNGTVTEWDGVPLGSLGSAYFRVSGLGDVNFTGNHTQSGKFNYQLQVYSATHALLSTISGSNIGITPQANPFKEIFVDPQDPSVANPALSQINGTVNVTVTNLVSPGDVDFYSFSGLLPGQAFTANINVNNAAFQPRLGLWSDPQTLFVATDSSSFSGTADGSGHVLVGVTAQGDTFFTGTQTLAAGGYTLTVTPIPVPEPGSMILLSLGGTLAFLFRRYRGTRLGQPG